MSINNTPPEKTMTWIVAIVGVVAILAMVFSLNTSSAVNLAGNAALSNSCSDSDNGVNTAVQGEVEGVLRGRPYAYTDTCSSLNTVKEFYCQGSKSASTLVACGSGQQCQSGRCVAAPPPAYCGDGACNGAESCSSCSTDCGACPVQNSCTDTDGGYNIWMTGNTYGQNYGSPYNYTDQCISPFALLEFYCNGQYVASANATCPPSNVSNSSCMYGRCV